MASIGGYEVVETLAEGEQGALHRARTRGALGFERGVLVREMRVARDSAAALVPAVRAACALVHPNIVVTWELGEHAGSWFLACELVDGRTLRRLLESNVPLSAPGAWRIVAEAARGLDALHSRGIVHGDVSPRTVLVSGSGDVKLRDAGVPQLAEASSRWRAPEQAHTNTDALGRLDDVGPWFLLGGQKVFANTAAILDGPLVPISETELGTSLIGSVWTGTLAEGTSSGFDCNSWLDLGANGTFGDSGATDANWTEFATQNCGISFPGSLYCFEQ